MSLDLYIQLSRPARSAARSDATLSNAIRVVPEFVVRDENFPVRIHLYDSAGAAVVLEEGQILAIGAKPMSTYDGDVSPDNLFYADDFAANGDYYETELNLNTVEFAAAIEGNKQIQIALDVVFMGPDELDRTIAQFSGLGLHDVLRGDEGTPVDAGPTTATTTWTLAQIAANADGFQVAGEVSGVGENVPSAIDSAYKAHRAHAGTGINLDQIRDESTIAATDDSAAYCSFDAQPNMSGASAYGHLAGHQDRGIYSGSGVLANWFGFFSLPVHSGTGILTNRYAVKINDIGGAGPVTNNYGVYVDALTRAGTANWAIYTVGPTESYFGGLISLGGWGSLDAGPSGLDLKITAGTGSLNLTSGESSSSYIKVLPFDATYDAALMIQRNDNARRSILYFRPTGTYAAGNLLWSMGMGPGENAWSIHHFDGSSDVTALFIDATGVTLAGTLKTTAGVAYDFGAVNAVAPTSPDRTITVSIAGTTYYLHAKTTND